MTLPNKLSLSRIVIIPFFLFALLIGGPFPEDPGFYAWFRFAALLLLVAASVTDWLDGYLARRTGEVSTLGILLDPLADKLLVTSAFVAFVELQLFPSWLIIIILCREFLVTGLRTVGAQKGIIIAADRWGKHKTGWQLATIITTLVFLTAREFLRHYGSWDDPMVSHWAADRVFHWILQALLIITVILTVISGSLYLVRNRKLLTE